MKTYMQDPMRSTKRCSTRLLASAATLYFALVVAGAQDVRFTEIVVSNDQLTLSWEPPTNRFIVEEWDSLLDSSSCAASSTGVTANTVSFWIEEKPRGFYRLHQGVQVFHFSDAQLDARVRLHPSSPAILPKYLPADEVYDIDLPRAETLRANSYSIRSIEGIDLCTSLVSLDLEGNLITDIAPLSGLTNLTRLNLWGNQITDVSPLADMHDLEYLQLGNMATLC